ncbi:heme peroxidase, partial [Rhodotorula diobovata]
RVLTPPARCPLPCPRPNQPRRSLLFGFAQLIVHSIFQTDTATGEINEASSYLDLSPVYGNNLDEQLTVRTGVQGLIHPDAVASKRIYLVSPSCVALAILFARNHNDIARRLVDVNEQQRFAPWDSLDAEGQKRQDLEVFNLARNINCGFFVNCIFQDYIRVILNLNKTDTTWSLVPTGEIKSAVGGRLARGEGNHASCEFNSASRVLILLLVSSRLVPHLAVTHAVLYRWHAAASEKDTQWLEGLMSEFNGGKPFSEMTTDDFKQAAHKALDAMEGGPEQWTFLGFKRTHSGAFRDEDLVKVFVEATDNVAGAFKARGTPEVMRAIDMLGMEAARKVWRCCSLNEFRRYLGLKEYRTFAEWNPDEAVARAAEKLYKHVDHLELYPGMMAEEAKPSMDGSGLAPGYTISRAILSDAAALVRGDRFVRLVSSPVLKSMRALTLFTLSFLA